MEYRYINRGTELVGDQGIGRLVGHASSEDEKYSYYKEDTTLRCNDPYRLAQFAIKLAEYERRAMTTVQPEVVRDTIAKMAILDILLRSKDDSVSFQDSFAYATKGIEMYGSDLLITSFEESGDFSDEFHQAFKVIESYIEYGNEHVRNGTQLPEAV